MFRTGKWAAAVALVVASVWAGFALTAQEPKPAAAPPADLAALREAVAAAAKKGENVDEVRKALAALEKALPGAKPGTPPPELRALRDAVEAAAKKGENVEAVQKELTAVEVAVAGRSFAPPRAVPPPPDRPQPGDPARPNMPVRPNPFNPPAFPALPDGFGQPFAPGRIDPEAFQKANDLRMKALELMLKNPNDPEALKLAAQANELMLKSLLPNLKNLDGLNGGGLVFPDLDRLPNMNLPDLGRAPERARLGIRFEKVAPVVAEQLGLDPDVGVAVATVLPGSAAERAGLKVHDIVLEFAGKPASSDTDAFVRQVSAAKAGEKLDIVVLRRGKKVEIKGVVLGDAGRPVAPEVPRLKPVPLPNLGAPAVPKVAPVPEKSIDAVDIRADAPASADLGDLRDAVAAAEKRGENVDGVRKALAALEKALAKGAAKPGEAPPELTALRDAVEAAAKKGENVGAISKELGAVEKALTGREYQRPKLEEPRAEPMRPEFPRRGGFGGGRVVVGGADGFNATSVAISNGDFVIRARLNNVSYTLSGTLDVPDGAKITIKDGDKTVEVGTLKKVPEEYRPQVEKLLKMVSR